MKRVFFISLLIGLFSLSVSAQESAPELVNAGNAAYAQKDYAGALAKWEAYLTHPDMAMTDTEAYTYKCAEAAKKAGQIEDARKYYQKCVALDYKADMCTFKLGSTYKKTDPEKYIAMMEKCVTDYPSSKYYKKYFLPSVTKYHNKAASVIFNEATAEQQVATGSGDAHIYLAKMEKTVLPLFNQAEAAFQKTLAFDPTESTASNAINSINTQREAYTTYKASLAAN
jgi:tetratricopeptide (TPR) repeat protein